MQLRQDDTYAPNRAGEAARRSEHERTRANALADTLRALGRTLGTGGLCWCHPVRGPDELHSEPCRRARALVDIEVEDFERDTLRGALTAGAVHLEHWAAQGLDSLASKLAARLRDLADLCTALGESAVRSLVEYPSALVDGVAAALYEVYRAAGKPDRPEREPPGDWQDTGDEVREPWLAQLGVGRTAVDDLGGNNLLWSLGVLAYQLLHCARTLAIRTHEQVKTIRLLVLRVPGKLVRHAGHLRLKLTRHDAMTKRLLAALQRLRLTATRPVTAM